MGEPVDLWNAAMGVASLVQVQVHIFHREVYYMKYHAYSFVGFSNKINNPIAASLLASRKFKYYIIRKDENEEETI